MPIKISRPIIEEQMAYFITDNNTSRGRDPNINIINGIHKIRAEHLSTYLFSNYTNKHLTFHKGEYVGHLEPAVIDDATINQKETHQTNSIALQKWWQRKSHPVSSIHTCHTLSNNIQHDLDALLKEYESQIAKDKTSIGTTPSHQHDYWHREFRPCLSEALPHYYETLSMGKGGNRKTTCSQGHPQ